MLLASAHRIRLAEQNIEIQMLLDHTNNALVQSRDRLEQSFVALSRERETNARHEQLDASRRVLRPSISLMG
jgi:hypothetical protein